MRSRLLTLLLLILLAVLVLAGCGGHSPTRAKAKPKPPSSEPFVCHHKVPAQAGECIRQELEHDGITPAAPSSPPTPTVSVHLGGAASGHQCIDISRYQTEPDFPLLYREGIRCVIVQTNYGEGASNPYFTYQVTHAVAAHIAVGAYVFELGECGSCQASTLVRVVHPLARDVTLGAWVDAEVAGAYGSACSTAAALHADGFTIYGVYSSPGLWPRQRCGGYIWPAEWGGGAPYPLPGYPSSAILFRQWCGTCTLGGVGEIDRDEDRGLLARAHTAPPKPKPVSQSERKRELDAKYVRRAGERYFLTRFHCRQPPWHVAVGLSGRPNGHYEHACHTELRNGAATNASIAYYHAHYHVF